MLDRCLIEIESRVFVLRVVTFDPVNLNDDAKYTRIIAFSCGSVSYRVTSIAQGLPCECSRAAETALDIVGNSLLDYLIPMSSIYFNENQVNECIQRFHSIRESEKYKKCLSSCWKCLRPWNMELHMQHMQRTALNIERFFLRPCWLIRRKQTQGYISLYGFRRNSKAMEISFQCHDDVTKWKHFSRYWPFVRGIHRWTVNSPH